MAPKHGPKAGTGGNRAPLSGASTPVANDGPIPQPFDAHVEYGGVRLDLSKNPALASAGVQKSVDLSRATTMGPLALPSEPKRSALNSPNIETPRADPRGGFPGKKVAAATVEVVPVADSSPMGRNLGTKPPMGNDMTVDGPSTTSVRGLPYDITDSPLERTSRGASNPHGPGADSNIPPRVPGFQLTAPGQTAGSNVQGVDEEPHIISQGPGVFQQGPGDINKGSPVVNTRETNRKGSA